MSKQFFKIFSYLIFFFLLSGVTNKLFAVENNKINQPFHFLTLSDIHFDPFIACHETTPCPVIQKLREAQSNEWPMILAKYDTEFPRYRQDSNYHLLRSSLIAAKRASQKENIQFVIVLGDFLGHDYRRLYKKYAGDKSRAGYESFVKKTMTFLTRELALAFPSIDVYAVVGNNDSYRADYYSSPNGQFFADIANLWSGLIKEKANRTAMQREFPIGGYYAIDIPHQPNLRLIVLNTVLFSSKAKGKEINQAANKELNWLHQQLELAKTKNQKVFIAMHIPAGIDVYATLQFRLFRLIELWETEYTKRFEAELKQFAPQLAGIFAGHLHSDWFQILTLSNANKIPVTGTPAISPLFGNNPGFKIYTYSPESEQLENYETYYYPMNPNKSWGVEYTFNRIYQANCKQCQIINGMTALRPENNFVDYYKHFYSVGTNSQPIVTRWNPYYWCATRGINADEYKRCVG